MWEDAAEPLHQGLDKKTCGIGPGMPFASRMLALGDAARHTFPEAAHRMTLAAAPAAAAAGCGQEHSADACAHGRGSDNGAAACSRDIGLVPCAMGDTCADQWAPGAELFTRMVSRTHAALSAAAPGATLRALLWYQGESDAINKERATEYEAKLRALLRSYREALQAPGLPILMVLIHCTNVDKIPFVDTVRAAQSAVAESEPGLIVVDARGLPLSKEDGVHLTAEAQLELGSKLADAALQHIAQGNSV